ncbi:hypothetical protein, partial [Stutzerimonas stutzeri]|uniref:hypothetical protein n=1 Tax=Stutzerimonas stutzeri TaxID=316 RepID=UPI00210B87DC
ALLAAAQQVVTEKYRQYEELANRGCESFHPATHGIEATRCERHDPTLADPHRGPTGSWEAPQ